MRSISSAHRVARVRLKGEGARSSLVAAPLQPWAPDRTCHISPTRVITLQWATTAHLHTSAAAAAAAATGEGAGAASGHRVGRLNHVAIAVPSVEEAAAKYMDVLGVTVSGAAAMGCGWHVDVTLQGKVHLRSPGLPAPSPASPCITPPHPCLLRPHSPVAGERAARPARARCARRVC